MSSSNLNFVGRLRYIQAIHEPPERQNPDNLVKYFLPILERWRYIFISAKELDNLRSQPFYYYLLARTKYYDEIFREAIYNNVQYIVNIGCGSDTRAHRFGFDLKQKGVNVVECDQPEAISVKQRMAGRLGTTGHVQYLSIDLNDNAWPGFEHWLNEIKDARVMVMMEGVSPYVNDDAFSQFLRLLGAKLPSGSLVAYDFKLRGVADNFGRVGRTESPFRLSHSREDVAAYHKERGFQLTHMELSWELEERLLQDLADSDTSFFRQDALIQIQVE